MGPTIAREIQDGLDTNRKRAVRMQSFKEAAEAIAKEVYGEMQPSDTRLKEIVYGLGGKI